MDGTAVQIEGYNHRYTAMHSTHVFLIEGEPGVSAVVRPLDPSMEYWSAAAGEDYISGESTLVAQQGPSSPRASCRPN